MNWLQEQLFGSALELVLGVIGAGLLLLIGAVARHMPKEGPLHLRIRSAIKAAPVASRWLTITSIVLIATVAAGTVAGVQDADPTPSATADPPHSPATKSPSADNDLAFAGWGPGRTVATADNRPSTPMLNSLVDHPDYGDERNFYRVKLADDPDARFTDDLIVEAGKVYEFAVIISNDAREGSEPLHDVRLRIQMPGVAKQNVASQVLLTSANTNPQKIWDGVNLVGEVPADQFALRYISSSAILHTGGGANGTVLADDVFENGVQIGCDRLDGVVPSGARCQSYVSFKIRIDKPNFSASALAKVGNDSWSQTSVATTGDRVTIMVAYRNRGTTRQDDVVLRVKLPDNIRYVAGSTKWISARIGHYLPASDDIADVGINVGSYAPGAEAAAQFQVTMDNPPAATPTMQTMENFLIVETHSGNKTAPLSFAWLE